MIQALLHNKLKKCDRSPYEVEDLLTSVVFGACEYCNPDEGLVSFLKKAVSIGNRADLYDVLNEGINIEYEFWPNWRQGTTDIPSEKQRNDRTNKDESDELLSGSEPEILLRIKRDNKREAWILIEAKLGSGKSSCQGPVNDQLGKYWLQLQHRADKCNAEAIALIYVTAHISLPKWEFVETEDELRKKVKEYSGAPFYWLRWRDFPDCINDKSPRILQDVRSLLIKKWQLIPVEQMKGWPQFCSDMTKWEFLPFVWPSPPSEPLSNFNFEGRL